MRYSWDETKQRKNVKKHKIAFAEAATVFDDPLFVMVADDDHSFSEKRFIILGKSDRGRLLVVGCADKGTETRIISARKATSKERKNYEEEI
ncbi:MAG TPA: BrnT family toxin [Pyrinomonadaceae bacterium]|nr:BrnT family toxin [Pyrinomonadaceae bacterium]